METYPDSYRKQSTGELAGFGVEVVQVLAQDLNFTPVFEEDVTWGNEREEEEEEDGWTGMVGSLSAGGRADMAVLLDVRGDRSEVIDFSNGVVRYVRTLHAHRSSMEKPVVLTRYFDTFSHWTWFVVGVTLPLCAAAFFFSRYPTTAGRQRWPRDGGTLRSGLEDLETVISMFLQHGSLVEVPTLTSKVSYFSTAVFAFATYICYSALLTAAMVSVSEELQIFSLNDLAVSDLSVYILGGGATYTYFESAPRGSPANLVYENKLKGNPGALMASTEDGFQRLNGDPKGVFYTDGFTLEHSDNFYTLKTFQSQKHIAGIGLRQGSPLREAVNEELRLLEEAGVVHKLRAKHGYAALPRPQAETSTESLGFNTVLLPFLSLGMGGLLGAILVLAELAKKTFCGCFRRSHY